jgi:hypothetical protein
MTLEASFGLGTRATLLSLKAINATLGATGRNGLIITPLTPTTTTQSWISGTASIVLPGKIENAEWTMVMWVILL